MRIQDFKVIYICPDHNEKYHTRKIHMHKRLTELGFKDIIHYKSGNEHYPVCLTKANIDILSKYMDEPILVLEDDLEFTDSFEFELDNGIDAIYFGLCHLKYDFDKKTHIYPSIFDHYSTKQVRVLNMLCTHAIFYISKEYKKAVIDILQNNLTTPHDISICSIQKDFLILANMRPLCYQSAIFNPCKPHEFDIEKMTKFMIKDTVLRFELV
jgi:hypothetical protein